MLKVSPQGTNNSAAKSNNKIKITKFNGVINGEFTPVTPPVIGTEPSLDFSDPNNSQYIPVI